MAQSEMLAQLRRNGGSGFDGQDRRFACKDGVGRGAGCWLEMAYRRREVWDTALFRYVPALPARPRDGDRHFAVAAREGANISRVRCAAGASTCDVDRWHLV